MFQRKWIKGWLGVELDPVSWREKLVSSLGALIAIFSVLWISQHALHLTGAAMFIGSMAATSVLLFAVPHGALSQPWPVLGGHSLSALVGVTCAQHIPDPTLAAACAVGFSIAVMHQCKCIHPPGGATALTAVLGGPSVHELGYSFAWHPVLLNALLMLAIAIAYNSFFPWRRYPAFLNKPKPTPPGAPEVTHEEVVAALESFDSFVDITEEDLIRLHHLLSRRVGERKA